ncbi:MAG: ComF family protein [Nannocystales bacterium]
MLTWLVPPACVGCRRLLRDDAAKGMCSRCSAELVPSPASSVGVFSHEGPMRRALSALKYERDLARAGPLGRVLGPHVGRASFDLAIAVPLHRSRQRFRGFNQSELLLREALREAGLPRPVSVLERSRDTAPQVGLPAPLRRQNVERAFTVRPQRKSELRGRRVLLFDDVVTTGATLQAAAQPLRDAGAEVSFLALLQAVA